MNIYIGKITFEDAGNSGGGEITAPCYITETLEGYSDSYNAISMSLVTTNEEIKYTNQLYSEWDSATTSASGLCYNNTQLVYAPAIDTSNVTTMNSMFRGCTKLKYVPYYNTSKVTNMYGMFDSCSGLTSLNLSNWDVSKVTNITNMFYGCKSLTSLNLSNWNMSKARTNTGIFSTCTSLINLYMDGATLPNINLKYLSLDTCTALSVDSLVSILNALPTTTNSSYGLKIGATNLTKLSDEQVAIGTNKGWTIE